MIRGQKGGKEKQFDRRKEGRTKEMKEGKEGGKEQWRWAESNSNSLTSFRRILRRGCTARTFKSRGTGIHTTR